MSTQVSTKGTLNKRETIKGFSLALLGAILTLVYTGLQPVIANFNQTQVFDFAPFFDFVNWSTAGNSAVGVFLLYFGYTIPSGPKKE